MEDLHQQHESLQNLVERAISANSAFGSFQRLADELARSTSSRLLWPQVDLSQLRLPLEHVRLFEQFQSPISSTIENVSKIFSEQIQLLTQVALPTANLTRLLAQQQLWTESLNESLLKANSFNSVSASIRNVMLTHELSTQRLLESVLKSPLYEFQRNLTSRLMWPQSMFANFANKTIERIANANDERTAAVLECSLSIAESQLLTSSQVVATMVDGAAAQQAHPSDLPRNRLVLPFAQQTELLEGGQEIIAVDLEAALGNSQYAQLCRVALRVQLLFPQCNEAAKISLRREIFKPTTRFMEAMARLPWTLAKDQTGLANVVDYLFWMIYEGAGDDTLRYHIDGNGPLTTDECNFVFWIKFLRNKWLRHDPDHGKDAKIDKAWSDVAKALSAFGIDHLPVTRQHFYVLHRRMLEEAEKFLTLLLEKLTKGNAK